MNNQSSWVEEALWQEMAPLEAPSGLRGRVLRATSGRAERRPRTAWALAGVAAILSVGLGMHVGVLVAPGVQVRPEVRQGQVSSRQPAALKPFGGFRQEDAHGACLLCHAG